MLVWGSLELCDMGYKMYCCCVLLPMSLRPETILLCPHGQLLLPGDKIPLLPANGGAEFAAKSLFPVCLPGSCFAIHYRKQRFVSF